MDSATTTAQAKAAPTVLVVDDESAMRTLYRGYLEDVGCRVLSAADGGSAIDIAAEERPDVIVMDLAMPRVDGWSAASQLKRSERTQQIPIIVLSAVQTARDSAHAAGCDVYLAKPCLPELLWWHIRAVLGGAPDEGSSPLS